MVIIHHTDADGWCGAAVCNHAATEDVSEVKFIPFNYNGIDLSKVERGERVICVDTSLNNNEEALRQWEQLFDLSQNVVFIDHHASTLDVLKEQPDFFSRHNVEYFCDTSRSGCYLAWVYFFCNKDLSNVIDIPEIVKIVDDFDRFVLKIPNSKLFVKSLDMYDCDPSTKEGLNFWVNLFDDKTFNYSWDKFIDNAKLYMKGQNKIWKGLRESSLYESEIEDENGNMHSLAVLNADGYSDLFGDAYNTHDACCLWNMNKDGKYSYSLYSHDNLFNCKAFAEKYGGGGHPGASGFTIDKLLFLPI